MKGINTIVTKMIKIVGIHGTHTPIYVDAINSFLEEGIK